MLLSCVGDTPYLCASCKPTSFAGEQRLYVFFFCCSREDPGNEVVSWSTIKGCQEPIRCTLHLPYKPLESTLSQIRNVSIKNGSLRRFGVLIEERAN